MGYDPGELIAGLAVSQASEIGRIFAENISRFSISEVKRILAIVEKVMVKGDDSEKDAATTGFLEAVFNAYDDGFDLQAIWPLLGPESRKYCISWNEFTGVPVPEWMRLILSATDFMLP